MRKIDKPHYSIADVYQLCLQGISDDDLRDRLTEISRNIYAAAELYDQRGQQKAFFLIPVDENSKHSIITGRVTKKELEELYTQYMVGKTKPARGIYDKLKANAPFGKCPFCGLGHVNNLDHYLPKTKFPLITVLPLNLVPACRDCNTVKTNDYATKAEEQTLHPYYDHGVFISDRWLYAAVVSTQPATLRFYVQPPSTWDSVSRQRVFAHFKNYELGKRFGVESTTELAVAREMVKRLSVGSTIDQIKSALRERAIDYEGLNKNAWQTAMYFALAESDWYCEVGFRL